MQKQKVIEEDDDDSSSFVSIQSEKGNFSVESEDIQPSIQQFSRGKKMDMLEEQRSSTKTLKNEKQYFIKQLLTNLGYERTVKTFQKECSKVKGDKNPEEMSNKKRSLNQKKKDLSQNYFKQLIQDCENYDQMVQALESIYSNHYESNYQHIANSMQQRSLNLNFQSKMKTFFSQKQEATVPKYKNIEIMLEGKEVKFIDVSVEQKLCLLDNEDYLHIISSKRQIKPIKVEGAKDIVYLKWINKNIIFLVNIYGKVTVFLYEINEIKKKEQISLKMPKIKRINSVVLQYPNSSHRDYVRLLIRNQNEEFIACLIVVNKGSIKLKGSITFQTKFNFKSFNLLEIPRGSIEQTLENTENTENSKKNIESDVEHYYGLADNSRTIIKFDTIVKKQGILWTSIKKIDSMANSKCRSFLILLLVDCKQKKRNDYNQMFQAYQSKKEIVFEYEFLKMNGHGCILQKVLLDFQSPLLSQELSAVSLSRMKLMDPDWLACFDWQDTIMYVSVKTGKILHIEDMQEDVRVIGVGSSNCLVCNTDQNIFLMSTRHTQKKRVVLENRPTMMRDRQSLILRLTRNGIPQTLLQLLQELRNNHVELIES